MTEHPALLVEERRAKAVQARDLSSLATCLHDALVYVHATGSRHGKRELLQFVQTGPEFLSVKLVVQQCVDTPDALALHGELRLQLRRAGEQEEVAAHSWASALWLRCSDGHWRLRLFHSTRMA